MKINEDVWKFYQKHLGYNDDEMKKFRQNPRNEDVISKVPALMNKSIVIEVVDAHGCASQHKVGDKFFFDGSGNLLTKLCPNKICFGALNAMPTLIFMAHELFYAGVDPNEMRFKRAGCSDVGIQCGGWGNIVMELKVEDRKKAEK
jgi:uncharacterized repeat protein (TIGR04076 family)